MEQEKIEQFNSIILDNMPASVITVDKNGFITSANKYYQNFARHKDYRNHNIFTSEFFIREKLTEEYKKLFADGTPVRRENCHETNNRGEDRYFKIIAVPFRDENGNIEGAISIGWDNTNIVLAEKKLIDLNNNLEKIVEERTHELNKLNEKLNGVLDFKSAFMADVSHELRNPLAIIQLELELLAKAEKIDKENFKEPLEQIFIEIKRMTTLLADISLLVNSDSFSHKLNYIDIDLNELLGSVIKSLKIQAAKKNIEIEQRESHGEVKLVGDREMLEKMLSNLIRNAIKYNKDNGWVKTWIEKTDDEIILGVEDSGMGIPEKDIPHIFDRFYRASNTKTGGKSGSGLGLAISKLIAEMHQGTIEVKSKINEGSLFTVKIPLKPEAEEQKG